MEDRYDEAVARAAGDDPVALRAYTSRLLGASPELVLHGGGNTSVKVTTRDDFGDEVELLYVKGSGWDLASIKPAGFSPVRLDVLKKLGGLSTLTDSNMVRIQRSAMTNPNAPNPSVEAILHAILPFTWVDHSHADALVTITNAPDGEARVREIFGDRVLIIPYVMPGFILAREVARAVEGIDWAGIEGMVLMNHGLFTFGETAAESYRRMIALVDSCETYLAARGAWDVIATADADELDLRALATLRRTVGDELGAPVIASVDRSAEAIGYTGLAGVGEFGTRGPVTPDHIIRTKRAPMVFTGDAAADVAAFASDYRAYFQRNAARVGGGLTRLDTAPRVALWPGQGVVSFGRDVKSARVVSDIAAHTRRCVQRAEALGGWNALGEADLFDMEYWELEQAKLARGKRRGPLAGKVAVVTGAARGIGAATVDALMADGAAVVGIDIDGSVCDRLDVSGYVGVRADLRDAEAVDAAVATAVMRFGGIDIVVSNAGTFPPSTPLAQLDDTTWAKTIDVNLHTHQRLLRAAGPFLALGFEPAVVIIGSKNVAAPGAGVAAYSVAKAGLAQLARLAAIEFGADGVRVNVVHPNAVFDTGLWDDAKVQARAENYGLSVDDYKRNNILGVEIGAADVARLVVAMAGPLFGKTTGAQLSIDGGNLRTI